MFEMKIAREREEKELLKRKWEEEEKNFWLQQSQSMYYAGQQHQMMPGTYYINFYFCTFHDIEGACILTSV